jgi:quercetin 2,3-dioxygenase
VNFIIYMLIRKMPLGSAILKMTSLGAGPMPTLDPFLFCVYHKDHYPPGNHEMEAPRTGNGSDFDASAPYRMYHGETIPGFPQHPHRGFETITATMEGIIDHADSVGNAGRYGMGDVQWMTAGRGCVHSEMFPLLKQSADNPTRFFQIWLNLPAAKKMVDPGM